jgi:peptidoglycan-associated lipoprotein
MARSTLEARMKFRAIALILAAAVVLTGCSIFDRNGDGNRDPIAPSGPLPVISFTITPQSGKAPLTSELRWTITNCWSATLTGVGDIPCNGSLTRTVSASTEYLLTAKNSFGDERSQRQTQLITP